MCLHGVFFGVLRLHELLIASDGMSGMPGKLLCLFGLLGWMLLLRELQPAADLLGVPVLRLRLPRLRGRMRVWLHVLRSASRLRGLWGLWMFVQRLRRWVLPLHDMHSAAAAHMSGLPVQRLRMSGLFVRLLRVRRMPADAVGMPGLRTQQLFVWRVLGHVRLRLRAMPAAGVSRLSGQRMVHLPRLPIRMLFMPELRDCRPHDLFRMCSQRLFLRGVRG